MEKEDGTVEEVERRHDLRGPAMGMRVRVGATAFEVVEASRRSFFVVAADPDGFRLGDVLEASIEDGGRSVVCRLEIIRKEIDPRRGVALRLVTIDPANEAMLRELLGVVAD